MPSTKCPCGLVLNPDRTCRAGCHLHRKPTARRIWLEKKLRDRERRVGSARWSDPKEVA